LSRAAEAVPAEPSEKATTPVELAAARSVAKEKAALAPLTAQAVLVERKCAAVKAAQAARTRKAMAMLRMANQDNSEAAAPAAAANGKGA
jgi:hypothetical protein